VISGGMVAYLQRADPGMLRRTAPGAIEEGDIAEPQGLRWLWVGLAVLMLTTPMGLLAAGTAWGEWRPEAFRNPEMRREIAMASHHMAPPEHAPAGFERLASIWTAPMPDYAPHFLKNEQVGYICSAMFGSGLVMLAWTLFGWGAGLLTQRKQPEVARPQ